MLTTEAKLAVIKGAVQGQTKLRLTLAIRNVLKG